MSMIVDDLRQAAEDVALAGTLAGYRLDFSARSMHEVDRIIEQAQRNLDEVLGDPGGLGHSVFALGGYVGEVLRRRLKGKWVGDDSDPDAEVNVSLHLRDGSTIWPVQRVMKRLANGSEDSVVAYAVALGLAVGDAPSPPGALARLRASAEHDPSPSALRRIRRWRAQRRGT